MTDERSEAPARPSIAVPAVQRSAVGSSSDVRAQDSEIERRLLALERVPRALVAHMAEADTVPCIQVRQMGSVWQVTKDGRFYGDFLKEEDALQAIKTAGGAVAPNT